MDDLKIAAAYIRVSTDDQTELSPDSQIKVVREFAKQKGYLIPKEYIFRDDGISGRKASKRPEFNHMIAVAKQTPSPFSAIMVWKFSRFARNQEEAIFYKGMLKKRGIDVISTSEPIIDGPFGSLIERIIEWFDEYYSINLSTEVKRGMTEKVSRGGAVSIPAFGYDIVDKKYQVNPINAPIVQRIFIKYLNGVGCRAIANELNDLGIKTTRGNNWENRTIEYILRNPVYIGKIRWNPKRRTRRNYDDKDIMIVDGIHQPIIDTDLFDKVQKKLDENKAKYRPFITDRQNGKDYMLKGLVKCSNCGATMSMSCNGLQCIKYTHGTCKVSHYIQLNKLNEVVINAIDDTLKSGDFQLKPKEQPHEEPQELNIDFMIEKENTKLRRIKEAYEEGVYNLAEFKQRKELIESKIHSLQKQNKPPEPKPDNLLAKKKLMSRRKEIISTLKSKSTPEVEKNALLCTFIDKIIFNRSLSSVELFFCF